MHLINSKNATLLLLSLQFRYKTPFIFISLSCHYFYNPKHNINRKNKQSIANLNGDNPCKSRARERLNFSGHSTYCTYINNSFLIPFKLNFFLYSFMCQSYMRVSAAKKKDQKIIKGVFDDVCLHTLISPTSNLHIWLI